MRDWVAVPCKPLSGFDITVVSPAGVVQRRDSLVPHSDTALADLQPGTWTVHNDSPCIVRLQAESDNGYQHINTLCSSEKYRFDWSSGACKLTAILHPSAQVFDRRSMDANLYS